MRIVPRVLVFGLVVAVAASFAHADTPAQVYRAMGIEALDVLTGTVLNARVVPGPDKQVVTMTTFFTGNKDKNSAVNVRLDIFNRRGEMLVPIYTRDFGAENGGNVGDGNLQIVDFDSDGVSNIYVSFDSFEDPLIEQRLAEVILHDGSSFISGWVGEVEYDATKAARNVPRERRDRFVREFDFVNTMRTRGVTLFVNKRMIAVAGQRLSEPRVIEETYPLRPPPDHW
jgi:hypothetical protein